MFSGRKWTQEEDDKLREAVQRYGKQWSVIARHYDLRDAKSCGCRWKKIESIDDSRTIRNNSDYERYRDQFTSRQIYQEFKESLPKVQWNPKDSEMLQRAFEIYSGDWAEIMQRFPEKTKSVCIDHIQSMNLSVSGTPSPDQELQQRLLQEYKQQLSGYKRVRIEEEYHQEQIFYSQTHQELYLQIDQIFNTKIHSKALLEVQNLLTGFLI